MPTLSRADKVIAAAVVLVLVAFVGMVVAGFPGGGSPTAGSGSSTPVAASDPRHASASSTSTSTSPTTSGPVPTTTPPNTVAPTTLPPPPTTATTTVSAPAPTTPVPVAGSVTAVGDSIMLDIQADLEADIPGVQVDGLVSRQFEAGIAVVQADRAAGTLGDVLVVELGTNGTVTSADVDAMMQAAAGVKRVVFVNVDVPRSWEAPDNAVLAAGVARYPGVAVLADWYTLSSPHPEWFTPDQVHLEPDGAQALATLIAGEA